MTTTKPKTKQPAEAPVDADLAPVPAVEPAPAKKTSKKSPAVSPAIEINETIALVEIDLDVPVPAKKIKAAKEKVIRDSFTFPEKDYQKISELKKTCLAAGIHVKKSEILRAGLHLLALLNEDELKQALGQVEKIKTGRPAL
ncbi:MAG: hypothetical protein NTV43_00725 [Methylococcales bacterium]|nr:hypothetical protein [Methylococcales bacterium]